MPQVVLHQFAKTPGTPSMSPFCCKVHAALRLKGIAYETRDALFAKRVTASAQLPYLEWDGKGLTDSSAIIAFLDEQSPTPRLVPQDAAQRAEAHVLEDWSDESLYWYAIYAKFVDPETWPIFRPAFAAAMPATMRMVAPIVTHRRMKAALVAQGVLRRTPELIQDAFAQHFDALEVKLGGRRYLVGDAISMADISVVSMLGQLMVGHTPKYAQQIERRPQLASYLKRLRTETGLDRDA